MPRRGCGGVRCTFGGPPQGSGSESTFPRFATTRGRLGLGAALSAGCHLLAIAGLTLFVTRSGSVVPGGGIADSEAMISVSDADDALLAEVAFATGERIGPEAAPASGPPASGTPEAPGPGAAPASGPPASGAGGALAARGATGAPTADKGSSRVATATVPAPSAVGPAAESGTTPAPGPRKAPRRASRSQPGVGRPATAPAPAIAIPDRPPEPAPAEPSPRTGTPGPSPRTTFLALMKKHLRAAWRAGEVYQRIDPMGRLEGSMFVTGFQVRLRADGRVERAEQSDSSGIRELDLEGQAAITRMQPLPPLPPELVDASGGFDVRCSFHLDVGLFRFANKLHHAIAQHWRPSHAFASTSEVERKTVVRLMLDRQGALVEASVVASAGIDFLDSGAVGWAKPGIKFPPPRPPSARARARSPSSWPSSTAPASPAC